MYRKVAMSLALKSWASKYCMFNIIIKFLQFAHFSVHLDSEVSFVSWVTAWHFLISYLITSLDNTVTSSTLSLPDSCLVFLLIIDMLIFATVCFVWCWHGSLSLLFGLIGQIAPIHKRGALYQLLLSNMKSGDQYSC